MNAFWVCVDILREWWPPLLWHIAPSIVTVVVGGLLLQRFFVRKANQAALIDALVKQMDQIQQDSLEYWNLDAAVESNWARSSLLEQKIKGLLRALNADVDYFINKHGGAVLFNKLMVILHDGCSGGDFESKSRKIEATRYLMVVNAVSNLKSALMRNKL